MDLFSDQLEVEYIDKSPYEYRKKIGQFFTPYEIARLMSEWILAGRSAKQSLSILDPGAGLGVFPRALYKMRRNNIKFTLYEIDPLIERNLQQAMAVMGANHSVKKKDYLKDGWEEEYDGIIANPPYYKHHFIENKDKLIETFASRTGISFSAQTNIYCWFFIKALSQLKAGGRIAFIVPSEFLNANYGVKIKEYLKESGIVLHFIGVDYSELVFDSALTTSLIILGEKTGKKARNINFYDIYDASKLSLSLETLLSHEPKKSYPVNSLDPKKKWRIYFKDSRLDDLPNLVPLSNLGRFSRGIATGSNNYFTVSKSEAVRYKLPDSVLIPCITKSAHANGVVFDKDNFNRLKDSDKKVFLFDGVNDRSEATKQYIRQGERDKVHQLYLTRKRKPWYATERRDPAQIWVSVFGRSGLKFIWNKSGARNLTCFHCFYPSALGREYMDIFFLYLNTPTARSLLDLEKREYGGGLEKYEPNDLNNALVIDFTRMSSSTVSKLTELQARFLKATSAKDRKSIIYRADKIFRMASKAAHQVELNPGQLSLV